MKTTARLTSLLLLILLIVGCRPTNGSPTATADVPLPTTVAPTQPPTTTKVPTEAASATPKVTPSPSATPTVTPSPLPPTPKPPEPTATATATATTPPRQIILTSPAPGATISSPVEVSGSVTVSPFEATLVVRVYDAGGGVVGEEPIMVAAEMGQPGPFSGQVSFLATADGPGQVEVVEISPRDGSVVVSAAVDVMLAATPGAGPIEIPSAGARVVLPLHLLARVGQAGQQITAVLTWQDGTELVQTLTALAGEDGRGLVIDTINWLHEGMPPQPPTQPATVELRDGAGNLLARQAITVLSADDPATQQITLYLVLDDTLRAVQRRVPRTVRIGTAALEELLWGPTPPNLAGFETALPTPQQVLTFPGREPDWGPRVTLRQLTIVDGVATADFSQEMRAYGGGSARVMLIYRQVEQTLKQFATVREVVIAIEGETEAVLEP